MDKYLKEALELESKRQEQNIELIASENYVSKAIRDLQGSILTNKYAEGYSGKRYYGGCEYIDIFELKAIEYVTKLFNCKYANVQPHSGSSANMAVYKALLNIGDKVLGMSLNDGGHLTHGHPINFSGLDYEIISYSVDKETEEIDYDELERMAIEEKPKMIIAGASAYSRIIDFIKFREIADKCGAYLMVDMAHIAGLVAANLHPSPFPYADVVTSTTHKTLRGPRGGIILTNNEEISKKIDKIVFPGIQGGPLMHVIGAKAQCFYEALKPSFKEYQEQVLKNAKALCDTLKESGFRIISGTTDNHLMLVDIKGTVGLTGKEAEIILDKINITCNKNMIPNDTESPFKTSGIRLGTPAMTTRGLKEDDFVKIGKLIAKTLKNHDDEDKLNEYREEVHALTNKYPLSEVK
ncbi:MAG: serine hydroxymethyltransferase [Bacilli bacterium]|nr:serine hydroxymethyltransferase [Bacilli bacterium]MDD4298787.1 serine hydroxymethyltransferase [Bacilli bacterium]MDD4643928.1 serine hydroxymethyltransferase [Bacilli bacterium]